MPRTAQILLWVESHAGHGAGKPLGKVISQLTDEMELPVRRAGYDDTDGKSK